MVPGEAVENSDLDRGGLSNSSIHQHSKPTAYLRVRCPECFRMYSVNSGEIRESKPRFECVNCKQTFWLAFPECLHLPEAVGFPISWLHPTAEFTDQTQQNSKPCPKCFGPVTAKDKECSRCGVVFEKLKMQEAETHAKASRRLIGFWDDVMESFDNEQRHQNFIKACQNENNLDFALGCYARLLEAEPTNERSLKMRNSIQALKEVQIEFHQPSPTRKNLSLQILNGFLVVVSILTCTWGWFVPEFRNMIGFGAALLFLSVALQVLFRSS